MADNERFYDESWEFQNNTSDRMLFKSADFESIYTDPETMEEYPAWKNDFEARFPEDTYEDITQLKTFMDWIVSTNRSQATGEALESPVTYGEVEYTTDSAEYRLAKFSAEIGDYAELDSLIFYYIFTELFLMVDSRAKNLFIGFHGSECTVPGMRRKLVAEPYDMDTGLGTNNEGTLTFPYGLEDTDLVGGAEVFNGQSSVMWCNLRDSKRAQIVQMYQTLRSSGGLSYAEVESRYKAAQDAWPEAVWNEDANAKYLEPLINPEAGKDPTDFYLPMCQGSKEQQRKWWLFNRFAYMDSKWNAGDALIQVIQLRGYAKDNITVVPYIDLYTTVKYGSYLVQGKAKAGEASTLVCPMDSVNDTEIYIYSANQIADVGDLSGLKVGVADFSFAVNLQAVKVGDADAGYENPNMKRLSFGNNVLLKKIDARNCSSLGTDEQKTVDVSNCAILEEVYFDGTAIQGLTLPNGGMLKKIHVPATMTNITIMNQRHITEFAIPSYDNVSTLRIENSSVDTKTMLNAIPANARVRLIGIDWTCQDYIEIETLLNRLDSMRGLDESGNNVATAQVSGIIRTEALTGAQVASYQERYPHIEFDAHVRSTRTYANWDGTVIKEVTCVDGVPQDTAPTGVTRTSTAQYSFTFAGWSKSMDAQTADPDALDNVLADRTIYAAYSRTVREYTVTWKNSDGTVLETDTGVLYGTVPTYNGSTPTYGGQTSTGWNPAVAAITGNTVYTATYKARYTVKFYNGSTLLDSVTVEEGSNAVYTGDTPVSPTDASMAFLGWTRTSGGSSADANALKNITANTSVYAVFESAIAIEEIDDTFANVQAAIHSGTHNYKVGNYVEIDMGTLGTGYAQIIGFNKDDKADGSGKAKCTWCLKDQIPGITHAMNASQKTVDGATAYTAGGYLHSDMRSYIESDIEPKFESAVRNNIVAVTKTHSTYNGSSMVKNGQTTTEKMFLLSTYEVFGDTIYEDQGPKYTELFEDSSSRIKNRDGSAKRWWLRSTYSASNFRCVSSGGGSDYIGANNANGLVLGFCTD